MTSLFFPAKLRRIAPSLIPLAAGVLIGVVWASQQSAAVTAQSPVAFPPTATFPPLTGPSAPTAGIALPAGSVTVIEARGGRDVAGSGDLIGFSHVDDSGTQVITMVDAEKRWMAVYHVGSQGAIRLVSSREIAADFTLELNATPPLPDQIRRMQGMPPRSP